jgi:hypothetical protein
LPRRLPTLVTEIRRKYDANDLKYKDYEDLIVRVNDDLTQDLKNMGDVSDQFEEQ